ncbi:MAG: hypothetical protein J5486_06285 [Bacteroidaceae bacterium]|nr:hypothetical protein [Bacteroidaceae bacterium]
MNKIFSTIIFAILPFIAIKAEPDPNFYIYLCFGQSNMEGNAKAEEIDNFVTSRFKMLATCDFSSPARKLGQWYVAKSPIVNPAGGLGPSDYFGRTLVAALPKNVKVGVIAVAMGGSPIEMFDKDLYEQMLTDHPDDWWAYLAKTHYGGNPYQRLIDMARKAQEMGVIKGILLHQGCSNNGNSKWPSMVKKIYNDMLNDLGLDAADVPLFVGETLREDQGGACWLHNTVVAKMPTTVPTSHVISSEGCPGNGTDPWHFSAMGYRMMGYRYAYEALRLMGRPLIADAEFTLQPNLKRLFTVDKLTLNIDTVLTLKKGRSKSINVVATFLDGHEETVTDSIHITAPDFITVSKNVIRVNAEGDGDVVVSYTDFSRKTTQVTIHLNTGDGTAISNVQAPLQHPLIYNICGQQTNTMSRGLNIVNGMKIYIP